MSLNRSNLTLFRFKATYHANPDAVKKRAGLSSYISRDIFQKFSNASTNNNVSL